jgi:hypothetical protein
MIKGFILLVVFGSGAIMMANHPEYIDYVKDKWQDTKDASIELKDDLKEEAEELREKLD